MAKINIYNLLQYVIEEKKRQIELQTIVSNYTKSASVVL